jgi:hypothetical protein
MEPRVCRVSPLKLGPLVVLSARETRLEFWLSLNEIGRPSLPIVSDTTAFQ